MIESLLTFFIELSAYLVAPIFVFLKVRRDWAILVFAFCSTLTLNYALMAVIRDFGGMAFLEEIGRKPWFACQYQITFYAHLTAAVALCVFLFRLPRRSA